jgi:hypothetical protein
MNQIMGINPKLVFDCFKAFEITSQAITSWIMCAGRGLISLKLFSLHKFLKYLFTMHITNLTSHN